MKAPARFFPFTLLFFILLAIVFQVNHRGLAFAQETGLIEQFSQLQNLMEGMIPSKPLQKQLTNTVKNSRQSYDQGIKFLDKEKPEQAEKHFGFALDELANYRNALETALINGQLPESTVRQLQQQAVEIEAELRVLITGNHLPIANAGSDQTITKGRLVTLDGSGSSDADGDTLSYLWLITQKPIGSQANLNNATTLMPTFMADQIGEYIISLQVSDGKTSSQKDIVIVTTTNSRPVANAGADQQVYSGSTVVLDGSDSSDVDGDALSYSWALVSKPANSAAVLDDATAVKPVFTADLAGQYVARLTIRDAWSESDPDTVMVNVEVANTPPVATAGEDQHVYVGNAVILDGGASQDADGNPLSYRWALVSRPQGSQAALAGSDAATSGFTVDKAGQYVAQLIVNDGQVDSEPDQLVVSTLNSRPVADAGSAATHTVGSTVTLSGSNSHDADGDTLTYRWSVISKPNGSNGTLSSNTGESADLTLDKIGTFVVQLVVNDGVLDSEPATVALTSEPTEALAITVTSPQDGAYTNQPKITMTGKLNQDATLAINSTAVSVGADLGFSYEFSLEEGSNSFVLIATNVLDQTASKTVAVVRDTVIPVKPDAGKISVSTPDSEGKTTITGEINSVEPGATIVITNNRTGESITVVADNEGRFIAKLPGQAGDTYSIVAKDTAGNGSEPASLSGGVALPPDPKTVAPPLDPTSHTLMVDATKFLYGGVDPIQTGVSDGTIEARRAGVIRGSVFDKDKKPLSGVKITIKDHPELGQTLSRADGAFDMAVNGGGLITVNYTKAGFLPVQRQAQTPWQDYAAIDDAILIAADSAVSTVNLTDTTQAFQVARGSVTTDPDGQRQATVLFPQNTTATMTLPDGSTQALSSLAVRATEYTVGENGADRMPGALPPSSGYTYAVELSVDEAAAAGAKRVNFSKPLPVYVDNFLGFSTGEAVPAGWYDYDRAAWIPSKNGVIIKLLRKDSSKAVIDVSNDKTDNEATQAQLDSLGITTDELTQLASLYEAGKSLWRVPVTHFTPWDFNWPYGPPAGAKGPSDNAPKTPDADNPDKPCEQQGCVIATETQSLGEDFGITGTPFSLHYSSERVQGRSTGRAITIPLSDANIPATAQSIVLKVKIAGQTIEKTFPPNPNQTYEFVWDGKDVYGRDVIGAHEAVVEVGYRYPLVYYSASSGFASSFGGVGNGVSINRDLPRNSGGIVLQRSWKVKLFAFMEKSAGLSGMGLNVHHAYDPVSGTLYMGNGKKRAATNINDGVLERFAGKSNSTYAGNNRQATDTRLLPRDIAEGPDGSIYFSEDWMTGKGIRKISPEGVITSVAGNDSTISACNGDGQPAVAVKLGHISDIAVSKQGRLYFSESNSFSPSCIRYVDDNGILRTLVKTYSGSLSKFTVDDNGGVYVDSVNGVSHYNINGELTALNTDMDIFHSSSYRSTIKHKTDGSYLVARIRDKEGVGDSIVQFDPMGGKVERAVPWPYDVTWDEDGVLYISTSDRNSPMDQNALYRYSESSGLMRISAKWGEGLALAEGVKLSRTNINGTPIH